MVTDHAPDARVIPQGPPRVDVSGNGALIAVVEPERISIASVPDLALRSEIGVDPEAAACEVAFLGQQLLIVSRYATHTLAYLVDPDGPHKLTEQRIEFPVYLAARSGQRALVTSSVGTALISAINNHLEISRLPIRSEPSSATGTGNGRFILNLSGSFEEWDGRTRAPLRRFKLARPQSVRMLGYSAQNLWWISGADPTRIEVLPVVTRGQAHAHVLPEPIARAVGHPDIEAVVVIGADTKRVYAVNIGTNSEIVKLGDVAADIALVAERKPSVVVVAQGRPAVLRAIDAHVKPAAVADEVSSEAEPTTAEENTTTKESTEPTSAPQVAPVPQEDAARFESATDEQAPAPAVPTDPKIAKRLLEWRERMRTASRTVWQRPGDGPTMAPTWRDELVAWGRSIANGLHRDAPPRPSALLKSAQARLNIPDELMPAIALGYAVHLNGTTASPADLATLLRHRWDEALGRGVLGALGVLRWRNSRISLAAAVAAYLDERGPVSGVLVGVPGEKLPAMERCAVVAPELPLDIVAGRCTALADAVLVPRPYVNATTIQLESKLRVAVPIVEVTRDLTDLASVFVRVASAEEADALGLRVIAEIGND